MIEAYDLQILPDCNAGGKRPHLSWEEEMAVPAVQPGSDAGAEEDVNVALWLTLTCHSLNHDQA